MVNYKPLVLIADDDIVSRERIKIFLRGGEYRIIEAMTGREAVEKALKETPDIILMDMLMPELNGIDAIQILQKQESTSRIPIIMLTGLEESEEKVKAFEAGALDFVTKPFKASELLAHVNSYIRYSLLNQKYILSTVDQRTGLPNKAAFREKLEDCENPLLFLISMENFNALEKLFGEQAAASLEKGFASFFSARRQAIFTESISVHRPPMLFRMSPGEFAILLDTKDVSLQKKDLLVMGKKFLNGYGEYEPIKGREDVPIELLVIISYGTNKLLEKAEICAVGGGTAKSGLMFAQEDSPGLYENVRSNLQKLGLIKWAVAKDRFVPYYQPILNGRTKNIVKYESLLRLIDPKGTAMGPDAYLDVAKKSKYYAAITKTVFTKTLAEFENRTEGISINISSLDIEDPLLWTYIMSRLKNRPEMAPRITLEIVEQENIRRFATVKQFITDAKDAGVKIAIDDFGSGYSNFKWILELKADYIKIDGSLIRRVAEDKDSRNVVETMVSFSKKSGIEVIAEFVENEEILDILLRMGVDFFQGYHIGKPGLLS